MKKPTAEPTIEQPATAKHPDGALHPRHAQPGEGRPSHPHRETLEQGGLMRLFGKQVDEREAAILDGTRVGYFGSWTVEEGASRSSREGAGGQASRPPRTAAGDDGRARARPPRQRLTERLHERIALLSPHLRPAHSPAVLPTARRQAGHRDRRRRPTLQPDAPVLNEHDRGRPLGYIRSLFLMPWVDRLTWHAALLELDSDDWPRNQPVSIGYAPIRETSSATGAASSSRRSSTRSRSSPRQRSAGHGCSRHRPRSRYSGAPDFRPPRAGAPELIRNCGTILRVR